jgi:hypothetical protein
LISHALFLNHQTKITLCRYEEDTTWHMCWLTFLTDWRIAHPSSIPAVKLLPKSANKVDGLTDCVTLVSNKVKKPFQVDANKVGILWWG